MTREELGATLALVNACLNGTSALCMLLGRRAISLKNRLRHRAFMLAAIACSALFLTTYLTRVALTGTHLSPHKGWFQTFYLTILGSHTILATLVVPFVVAALVTAHRGRFESHKRIVRYGFPIWLYVSITGVLVYCLLYRIPPQG